MILESALICMALNVYHETRNQSLVSQLAVSQVVLNRVYDDRYPNTVCEVVKQGITYKNTNKPVLHKCQFSWYCDGKKDEPKNKEAWNKALKVASKVLHGRLIDLTEGSTHYHAYYVKPSWTHSKSKITRIESHIFYRWEKKKKNP